MTELSPAAQAVLDALCLEELNGPQQILARAHAAAALEAAADQVVPEEPSPTGMRPCGEMYSAREIRRNERMKLRSEILAIAAELRAARRPKPLSLKEQSLKHLEVMERDGHYLPEILQDLRRALEQLND
jgi:hypothetical protein